MKINLNPTKLFLSIIPIVFGLIITAQAVFAQITNPAVGDWGNVADSCEAAPLFVEYFVLLWKAVIGIGGIIVLVMFVYAALQWVTAGGEADKLAKARGRMIHSAVGLLLLVTSFSIISFVSLVFFEESFDILSFSLPTALDCSTAEPPGPPAPPGPPGPSPI